VDLPEELDPLQDVDSLFLGDGLDVHLVNVLKKGKNIFSYKNDLQHWNFSFEKLINTSNF
jgi:hypothetical protein